jgi:hypothetical protein
MQEDNRKQHKIGVLRKIIIIVFLPVISFTWIIGWILTQIGSQSELTENSQKTLEMQHKFETHLKESELIEETKITHESPIVA